MADYDPYQPQEVKKPKWDVYSTMLMVALVALILGCVALGMEMDRYEWKMKAPPGIVLPSLFTSWFS